MDDVEGTLAPGPGWQRRTSLELDEAGWHLRPFAFLQSHLTANLGFNLPRRSHRFVIDAHRRGLRAREPVDRDRGQQFIFAEAAIEVPTARSLVLAHNVGQEPPLVDDPGHQPNCRVLQVERHGLKLGPVDSAVRGIVADVWFLLLDDEAPLIFSLGTRGGAAGRQRGHRHVDSSDALGMAQRELSADCRAPVAAVIEELLVAQPRHQLDPHVGDRGRPKACLGRNIRPAVPRQRRRDHVERRIVCIRRFSQFVDDLVEVVDRRWPAMLNHQRTSVWSGAAPMNEVDAERLAIPGRQGGFELWESVEQRLNRAPVEFVGPVGRQILGEIEVNAIAPA